MNVFGGSTRLARGPRGLRGEKGEKGEKGEDGIKAIVRWFPDMALSEFRKSEKCCLLITDPSLDLVLGKGGKYIAWCSRATTTKHDAEAIRPSGKIVNIKNGKHALVFDNNSYIVHRVILSPARPNTFAAIWTTFQVDGMEDQFIVSNATKDGSSFRGISASNKEIRIWGAVNNELSYIPIEYTSKKDDWITVYASWSTMDGNRGEFVINDNEINGRFKCENPSIPPKEFICIGARLVDHRMEYTNPLKGAIASIEVYNKLDASEAYIPAELHTLITRAQLLK